MFFLWEPPDVGDCLGSNTSWCGVKFMPRLHPKLKDIIVAPFDQFTVKRLGVLVAGKKRRDG